MINALINNYLKASHHKMALAAVFIFYVVIHACVFALNYFASDDYMQRVYAVGSPALESMGLLKGIYINDLQFFINNQFNFFDPQAGNDIGMRNYGVLPWWTKDQAMLHLWRPVSSLTHWMDYRLWPDSPDVMQWHNGIWLLLSFISVALVYKKLLLSRAVLVLALLIYGLDISIAPVVGWIAARNSLLVIFFLALTLYFFHRSFSNSKLYVLAILSFIMALLSAEAAIVVMAYLASYVLFFPLSTVKEKSLRFIPFLIITIAWRWFYHSQGYGAFNIGQYIDPFRSPVLFLHHAISQFPVLFIEMATGIDAIEILSPVKNKYMLVIIGWVLFFLLLTVSINLYKRQSQIFFWFSSSVFSLVPGLMMYSTDPRVVIYAHIAFSVVLSLLIVEAGKQYRLFDSGLQKLRILFVLPVIILHIFLQFLAVLLMNYTVFFTQSYKPNYTYDELYGFRYLVESNSHVILLNHRDVFRLMYYPYIATFENYTLPLSLRQISTAQTEISVRKLSSSRYVVEPGGGFILHPQDMDLLNVSRQQKALLAGYAIKYAAFFHDGDYQFSAGDKISLPEMELVIGEIDVNRRPMFVEMRLHPARHYQMLYWDWPSRTYKFLPDMKDGEIFVIPGPQ